MNPAHFINKFCLAARTDCGRAVQRKTELSRGAQFVPAQGLESNPGHTFLSRSQASPVPYVPLSSDETQSAAHCE